MRASCLRHLAVLLVSLGILLPGLGAAGATFLPGAVTLVICDGDGLRRITLDADGMPVGDVALTGEEGACALLAAALPLPGPLAASPVTLVPARLLPGHSGPHLPRAARQGGGPRAPPLPRAA